MECWKQGAQKTMCNHIDTQLFMSLSIVRAKRYSRRLDPRDNPRRRGVHRKGSVLIFGLGPTAHLLSIRRQAPADRPTPTSQDRAASEPGSQQLESSYKAYFDHDITYKNSVI